MTAFSHRVLVSLLFVAFLMIGTFGSEHALGQDDECTEPSSASRFRRLSHREYQNTIQDVFGLDVSTLVATFPANDSSGGFTNTSLNSSPSVNHIEKYREAAFLIANAALKNQSFVQRFVGKCPAKNQECARGFVHRLSLFLFRDVVDDESVSRFLKLYSLASASSFETGLEAVTAAMLLDPRFLYHYEPDKSEKEGIRRLKGYEIASRLSYFLWHSVPDFELFQAASRGELSQKIGLEKQIMRMLNSPKAERAFQEYIQEWLALSNLSSAQRSNVFPEFSPQLLSDMKEEVLRYFHANVFKNKGSVTQVFTANSTFASGRLARLYGFSVKGEEFSSYLFSESPNRQGVLTMPGVLTGLSAGDTTSIVRRGLYFNNRFLCVSVPPPPPDGGMFDEALNEKLNPRERSELLRSKSSCASCHNIIDPVALGLEVYDSIGKMRTTYPGGQPIETFGQIRLDGKIIEYQNAAHLSSILSKSHQVKQCWVQNVMTYARGSVTIQKNKCEMNKITNRFIQNGESYEALLKEVVKSRYFQTLTTTSE